MNYQFHNQIIFISKSGKTHILKLSNFISANVTEKESKERKVIEQDFSDTTFIHLFNIVVGVNKIK